MKRIKTALSLLLATVMIISLGGCDQQEKTETPTEVTLWHVYGAQTDSPLNDLIDEFNETVGVEQNIRVKVTSVSNTNTIHEGILAAAFDDAGAPEMPDMFVSYPKTVLAMPDDTVLIDYNDYFTNDEIQTFIPSFIEEGTVNGRLVSLPVAKSTEIMFINQTAFDRFSAATGAEVSDLSTWEGLFDLAEKYVAWTDDLTPDVEGDGKVFFVHDYHFNYFQVGVASMGEDFFNSDGKGLAFGDKFNTAWKPYAEATVEGGVWLESGYATEPLRTGDAIVSVASSASVLYYSNTVTYSDNTTETVEIKAYPCPTFKEGEKLVMQRGAGICTVKSTPEKENACITFLKWLTDAKRNVDFVTSLGYMPVKQESFDVYLPEAIDRLEKSMYVSLYQAFLETQDEYAFYTPPQIPDYLALETKFEENVRLALKYGRSKYLEGGPSTLEEQIWTTLEYFKKNYQAD